MSENAEAVLKILVINPNTSTAMTSALQTLVGQQPPLNCHIDFFTAPLTDSPGSLASINSPGDATKSAEHCFPYIKLLIGQYDGFLVACYSQHPLVSMLQQEIAGNDRKFVQGIFEASVSMSLAMLTGSPPEASFGIVSTGKVWEDALSGAVEEFLGSKSRRFAGVTTTGLMANELHTLPEVEVETKLVQASRELIAKGQGNLRIICMGCAGMTGLDKIVQTAVAEQSQPIAILDGVLAGIQLLIAMLRL